MSEQNNEGVYASTALALLSFPNLDEARAVKGKNGKDTGEPKFSANLEMLPENPDLAAAKALCLKLAKAKWPGRAFGKEAALVDDNGNPKQATFQFPFTSGDKHADKAKAAGKEREWSRGKVVLTARSKFEPRLSAIIGGKVVEFEGDARLVAAKKHFYTGAEVLWEVNFQAYDGVGQNGVDGVTAYLNMVLASGKGSKIAGGGRSAADVFKGYVGTVSGVDPTAGLGADLDDEIPF